MFWSTCKRPGRPPSGHDLTFQDWRRAPGRSSRTGALRNGRQRGLTKTGSILGGRQLYQQASRDDGHVPRHADKPYFWQILTGLHFSFHGPETAALAALAVA